MQLRLWSALASVLAVACQSSDRGYDAAYDCEQTIACAEETRGPASGDAHSSCIEASNQAYAGASAGQRTSADELFAACSGLMACEYTSCIAEESGNTDGRGSSIIGSYSVCNEGPLEPNTGEVPSSAGPFAFSEAEALYWVSNEHHCLTGVGVELHSGPCSVSFSADKGLIDREGRFLITNVTLNAGGLCPGYPDLTSSLYLETATSQPFGTIEIIREEASWYECREGQVIVRPSVTLRDFGGPAIELRDFELVFSGGLSRTHLDPSGACPVELF